MPGAVARVAKPAGGKPGARSKVKRGDPCSEAVSEWKLHGMTSTIAAILGRCHKKGHAGATAARLEHRKASSGPRISFVERARQINRQRAAGEKRSNRAFHLPASKADIHVNAAAHKNEAIIAKAIGAKHVGDFDTKGAKKYLPYDAHVPAKRSKLGRDEFVEIKMRHNGKKSTLGVKDDALLRKIAHHEEHQDSEYHSVLMDIRDRAHGGSEAENYSGHDLYYKRGTGDYALSKMHKVSSLKELKELMAMPGHELPAAARGTVPQRTPELEAKARNQSEGRKARDAVNRANWRARQKALREQAKAQLQPGG